MVPAPGIGLNGNILLLNKALHGLKQASLAWFDMLPESLADIGYIYLTSDPCVFISAHYKIIVVVYVDDITTAASRYDINRRIDHLRCRFKFTVKGSLKYIHGIEIKHTPAGMELSQHQYITDMLSRFGVQSC